MTFPVTDASNATQQLLTGAELSERFASVVTAVSALTPLLDGVETLLTNVIAAVNSPSGTQPLPTGAATQATLASLLAKTIAAPATEAKQDAQTAAIGIIGTRAYGAGVAAMTVGTNSSASAAIAATEVLLHASAKCFVRAGAAATVNDIPLEAGEKFTLRITSGQTINAIAPAGGTATLNIVPVA